MKARWLRSRARQAAAAFLRPWSRGQGCIICLHRVVPESARSSLPANRALEITPETLGAMLDWCTARGLEPITIDEVPERLGAQKGRGKWIVWTLDDGYRDNLEVALPVFRARRVPATVHVTPGFITGRDSVWWYLLERFAGFAEPGPVTAEARVASLELERQGRRLRAMTGGEREEWLRRRCDETGIDAAAVQRGLMLDLDGLRTLAADPLVTIGAHGRTHAALRSLSEDGARAELAEGRQELADLVGSDPRHLAFPYGGEEAVGLREFALAKECGFATASTTRSGNLHPHHHEHLYALPRLTISGNYDAVPLLSWLESGAPEIIFPQAR